MDENDIKKILETIGAEKHYLVEALLKLFADKETGAGIKLNDLEITLGDYQIILSGDFRFSVKTRKIKK